MEREKIKLLDIPINKRFCDAVGTGNIYTVKAMLKADPNSHLCEDEFGWSPLHVAVQMNRLEICKLLIEKGACLSVMDAKDEIPIELAISRGYFDICKILYEAGVVPTVKDLRISAMNGDDDICELLLGLGVPINSLSNNLGNTALHAACEFGYLPTIKFLLSRGADYTIKNKDGKTPYDAAGKRNSRKREAVLKELRWFKRKPIVMLASGYAQSVPGYKPNLLHRLPEDLSRHIATKFI